VQLGARRPFQRARLRYDHSFAFEAEYCFEKGIPHSEFLERWSREDRAVLAAVASDKAARCTMCGTSEWQWAEDPFAYEPMFIGCTGCMKKALLDADDTPRPKGTTIQLVHKETAERMRRAAAEGISRPKLRRSR
jgi:hypothetical protein